MHNEAANLNEAHHEPSGNTSYNPDKSITNKHVQGRFLPPKADNMAAQPQQQSSSEVVKRTPSSMDQDTTEKGVPRAVL